MTGGVFFDFDGTLIDTFEGIIEGIQRMRAELGGARLPAAEIRRHIGWGIANLIRQCLPAYDDRRPDRLPTPGELNPEEEAAVAAPLALFRRRYAEVMVARSAVYPGIRELCGNLTRDGFALAVVSNKPERFVRRLLAAFGLVDPFRLVIGGDRLAQRKPDPEPLHWAARQLALPVTRCVMVGDSTLDLEAARAAGMPAAAVAWGLLPAEQLIEAGPAILARSAAELESWIRQTLRMLRAQPALEA